MEDKCVICADGDELYLICLACKKYTSCKKCYKKFVATKTICPLCDNTLHNRITEWDKLTKSLEQSVLDTYIKHEMSIIRTKHLELEEYLKSLTTINDEIAQRNAKTIISDQQKTIRGRIKYEVEREIEYVLDFVYYSTVGGVNAKLAETTAKIVGEISEMLSVEYIKSAISLEKITHIMNVEYVYGYPFSVIDKMDMDLSSGNCVRSCMVYSILLSMAKRFGSDGFKICEKVQTIVYKNYRRGIIDIVEEFIKFYNMCKLPYVQLYDPFRKISHRRTFHERRCTGGPTDFDNIARQDCISKNEKYKQARLDINAKGLDYFMENIIIRSKDNTKMMPIHELISSIVECNNDSYWRIWKLSDELYETLFFKCVGNGRYTLE
jgi:hypothetical protein